MPCTPLHQEAITPALLDLLRSLMADEALGAFHLVGGTALALWFAHRRSIDIDLFTPSDFDSRSVAEHLVRNFAMERVEATRNTVRGMIGDIKTDLLAHVYPMIDPPQSIEGIRMASMPDLAAMKLNAIANRGSKKDFWDYATLLARYTHPEMLSFYSQKYRAANTWHVEKSVLFFDDAEQDPDPVSLTDATWPAIKSAIRKQCQWPPIEPRPGSGPIR